jgi:enoyl-CoA hydratase
VPVNEGTVNVERENGIATLVISQPKRRNALTLAMWESIPAIVADFERDDSIRLIVLRGAGRDAFSAGADISEFEELRSTPEKALDYNRRTHRAFDAVVNCAKPTIAMIYGFCIGGGCELAIACDLRVAADNAVFGIPAARLGISLGWEDVRRLVALVGPANAKEILFTGGRLDANRAYAMGMLNSIVPADDVETEVSRLSTQILAASPASIRWSKQAIGVVVRDPSLASVPSPEENAAALFGGEDYREGVRAFLEKRTPRFTGR